MTPAGREDPVKEDSRQHLREAPFISNKDGVTLHPAHLGRRRQQGGFFGSGSAGTHLHAVGRRH